MLTSVGFLPTGLFPSLSKILSNNVRKLSQGIAAARRPKTGFSYINFSCGSCGSQKLGWKLVCGIDDAKEAMQNPFPKELGSALIKAELRCQPWGASREAVRAAKGLATPGL